MPAVEPLFCQVCGARLSRRRAHGAERLVCDACGFIHFHDPKVAVGVMVHAPAAGLLYTLRNHEPRMGEWAFPSGYVNRGEDVEAAACREVQEETGLDVALDGLLGVYSRAGHPLVFIAYHGHVIGGTLAPGDEAMAVRFFPLDALPPPTFPFDEAMLGRWREIHGVPA